MPRKKKVHFNKFSRRHKKQTTHSKAPKNPIVNTLFGGLDLIFNKIMLSLVTVLSSLFSGFKNFLSGLFGANMNKTHKTHVETDANDIPDTPEAEATADASPAELVSGLGSLFLDGAKQAASRYIDTHTDDIKETIKDNADTIVPAVIDGLKEKAKEVVTEKTSAFVERAKNIAQRAKNWFGSWFAKNDNPYQAEVQANASSETITTDDRSQSATTTSPTATDSPATAPIAEADATPYSP